MYSTVPPKDVMSEPISEEEYMEMLIADHIAEEQYDMNDIKQYSKIEEEYYEELTKHESKGNICFF